jgi:nicotinate-nucleotide adenylyltransferase
MAEADGPGGVRAGDMLPEAAARPYFMMGAESFAALDTWRRGLEMPKLAHLVMVPRGGEDRALFRASVRRFWPETALPEDAGLDSDPFRSETVSIVGPCAGGGSCTFLPVPRLDISSTFVRQRWREGRSLAGLVPKGVLALMKEHEAALKDIWG